MNDPFLVRRLQRGGEIARQRQRLVERDRTPRNSIRERRPLDQFHDQRRVPVGVDLEPKYGGDVRMMQCGECLRFTPEAGETFGRRVWPDRKVDEYCEMGLLGAIL